MFLINGKCVLELIDITGVVTRLFVMIDIRIEKSILAARTEDFRGAGVCYKS